MQLLMSADVLAPVGVGVLVAVVAVIALVIGLQRRVDEPLSPTDDDWTGEHVGDVVSPPARTVADAVAERQGNTGPFRALPSSSGLAEQSVGWGAAEPVSGDEPGLDPVVVAEVDATPDVGGVLTGLPTAGGQARRLPGVGPGVGVAEQPSAAGPRHAAAAGGSAVCVASADPVTVAAAAFPPPAAPTEAPVSAFPPPAAPAPGQLVPSSAALPPGRPESADPRPDVAGAMPISGGPAMVPPDPGSVPGADGPVDHRLDARASGSIPGVAQPAEARMAAEASSRARNPDSPAPRELSPSHSANHHPPVDASEPASTAGSSQSVAAAVAQVLAARAAAQTPDSDRRGEARDRLLAVLLDDPLRAVGAAVDLQDCQERLDRLAASVHDEHGRLGDVLGRLARSGLRPDQLARLSGLSDAEVADHLRRGIGG